MNQYYGNADQGSDISYQQRAPKAYSVGYGARQNGYNNGSPQSFVNGMAGNRNADAYSNFSGMSQNWQNGPPTVGAFDSKSVQRAANR